MKDANELFDELTAAISKRAESAKRDIEKFREHAKALLDEDLHEFIGSSISWEACHQLQTLRNQERIGNNLGSVISMLERINDNVR